MICCFPQINQVIPILPSCTVFQRHCDMNANYLCLHFNLRVMKYLISSLWKKYQRCVSTSILNLLVLCTSTSMVAHLSRWHNYHYYSIVSLPLSGRQWHAGRFMTGEELTQNQIYLYNIWAQQSSSFTIWLATVNSDTYFFKVKV